MRCRIMVLFVQFNVHFQEPGLCPQKHSWMEEFRSCRLHVRDMQRSFLCGYVIRPALHLWDNNDSFLRNRPRRTQTSAFLWFNAESLDLRRQTRWLRKTIQTPKISWRSDILSMHSRFMEKKRESWKHIWITYYNLLLALFDASAAFDTVSYVSHLTGFCFAWVHVLYCLWVHSCWFAVGFQSRPIAVHLVLCA